MHKLLFKSKILNRNLQIIFYSDYTSITNLITENESDNEKQTFQH